jgi:hypothetical protein
VRQFYTALNDDKMHSCLRCKEHWFDMKLNSLSICSRCISRDRKKASDLLMKLNPGYTVLPFAIWAEYSAVKSLALAT